MMLSSKLEIRNPKQTKNSKLKIQNLFVLDIWILDLFRFFPIYRDSGFVGKSFGFRI